LKNSWLQALEDCPGLERRKTWRIPKSIVFPTIGPNLATFSPTMGATRQRTDSVNLEDLIMFRRTVLTSFMLVFVNANREIHKRTDTAVAFTLEYSKVSISMGNAKWTNQGASSSKDKKIRKMFFCG
jgi:hypothetical protein